VAGGLFSGFLYGAVIGVLLIAVKIRGRKQQIPFGPFLAAGAMTFVLFGEPIVDWYRHLGR
jgi:leader peptidase (prepilin peptidase)/N-methyltransferase